MDRSSAPATVSISWLRSTARRLQWMMQVDHSVVVNAVGNGLTSTQRAIVPASATCTAGCARWLPPDRTFTLAAAGQYGTDS
jgi:hypothetical protein